MANKTTLVDNNTWNNSHIALVGKAMSSNETAAYDIMTALDVDYVLVIFGGVIGYSGDDINKFLWMVSLRLFLINTRNAIFYAYNCVNNSGKSLL